MSEWWINNAGQNLLKGLHPASEHLDNPALVDDTTILDWLNRIPAALRSFDRLVGSMSAEEQVRLRGIRKDVTQIDRSRIADGIQARWNQAGVRPQRKK